MSRELLLNPSRWIILAKIAPPPSIRVGPERVLGHNVRWGRRGATCGPIHLRGLRVKLIFNIPMDSTKTVGRRNLRMSVRMTVSRYYALATSPVGEPIARAVGYGPCGAQGIDFWPCAGSARSKLAKSALAAANVPAGHAGGEYRDRSTESRTVPIFGPGIVTRPRVVPHEPSASPLGPILRSGTSAP